MQGKNPETIPGLAARSRMAGAKVLVWYFLNQDGQDYFRIFRIVLLILGILLHPGYLDSKFKDGRDYFRIFRIGLLILGILLHPGYLDSKFKDGQDYFRIFRIGELILGILLHPGYLDSNLRMVRIISGYSG
ncbi:Uncharacterized protein dnl_20040 [Desulfonema limicola]|uniref:Uncharacterized protein n=1 Tax=Desulfonema limicola TaxID=45656 RepID=A0A975B6T5_9BACT|nr:hypothetical protein [Desulfonema limicola]QTA79727.1 Uncharacterized protein dnl_20040 [Desulfonema limicola]